jgi:UDP-2,4-diacetamido-2,4,6-trideoxy-beta-L-altropyranose hydrolase
MRCLALAQAFQQRGHSCRFVSVGFEGNLIDYLERHGMTVSVIVPATEMRSIGGVNKAGSHLSDIPLAGEYDQLADAEATLTVLNGTTPDWLIVDHYALDERWERHLRSHVRHLMVIDDLANRTHDCDALLDQNLGRNSVDYLGRIPEGCRILVGPEFALLRPEFAELRAYSLARRQQPELRYLLISMGGVDQHNVTGLVLKSLKDCRLPPTCRIVVVMGAHTPWLDEVRELSRSLASPCEVRTGVENIAKLMADSDLAIGAAGITSWERCCLGLPSIIVAVAANQIPSCRALAKAGAARMMDSVESIQEQLVTMVTGFLMDKNSLKSCSSAAAAITSGKGTQLAIDALVGI